MQLFRNEKMLLEISLLVLNTDLFRINAKILRIHNVKKDCALVPV